MTQDSSEKLQEVLKFQKPNSNTKSVIKSTPLKNPLDEKENKQNLSKGSENKFTSFTVTDLRNITNNEFGLITEKAKNETVKNQSQEKSIASEKKTVSSIKEDSKQTAKNETGAENASPAEKKFVSSISENSDDDEDDFIDFDLAKGLRSISPSELKMKSSSFNGSFSHNQSLTDQNSSIDPCAFNCSKVPHIACGHNWSLSPKCTRHAKVINLDKFQSLILHQHNTLRNNLAGNLTKFEPAVRMGTTQWHNELAEYALLNAMSCEDDHDFCHNTKEFKWTGQNLASHYWWGRKKDLSAIITKMISGWYSENVYAEQSDLDKFHRVNGLNNEVITHFTSVINERNTHIGCAAVADKKERFSVIYFSCNYARNNIMNLPIYEKGPTASKCLTGVNSQYTNLCSENEVYKYNV
ncbi:venom allergen-1-like [Cochliomyia hominivorax]